MDSKLKTGLLTAGIVLGLAAMVGGILLVASAGGRGTERPGSPRRTAPTELNPEARLAFEVAEHSWWKTKPSERQAVELADTIAAMQADEAIEITPTGSIERQQWKGIDPNVIRAHLKADSIRTSNLFIFLDGQEFSRRLTRKEALTLLKKTLDTEDFRKKRG